MPADDALDHDRLDRFLDDLVAGSPLPADRLVDHDVGVTARRLHALDAADPAPSPDPLYLQRLEASLMDHVALAPLRRPRAPLAASLNGRSRWASLPRPTRPDRPARWWPALEVAAACLLLAVVGGYVAANRTAPPSPSVTPPSRLVASDAPVGTPTPTPANVPVRLRIAAIDVDAPVQAVSAGGGVRRITSAGPDVVSWYDDTAPLGAGGNTVLVGDVDHPDTGPAVFWGLDDLMPGDSIEVAAEDGTVFFYDVTSTRHYAADELGTGIVGSSPGEKLTLVTEGGEFDYDTGEYLERLVVAATRLSGSAASTPAAGPVFATCPVTLPREGTSSPGQRSGNHGTAKLRTIIYDDGVVPIPPHWVLSGGELAMKFPWYWDPRAGTRLVVEGRRLDAPATPLRAEPLTGAASEGVLAFQALRLIFPTAGCWEVTGRVGEETIAFVAVVRLEQAPTGPSATSTSVATPASPPFPCPVTLPNGDTPPTENPSPDHHGRDGVWTALWPEGRVVFQHGGPGSIRADGSLAMKWPWWWLAPGQLSVTGRRLDAVAPPLIALAGDGRRLDRPLPVSGESPVSDTTRHGFLPASLVFPSAGCWEITARVGEASLTFVALVEQGNAGVTGTPATAAIPEPTECTVVPRTVGEVRALEKLAREQRSSPVASLTAVDPNEGKPADSGTVSAVSATLRKWTACGNAGDSLRVLALYTDRLIRESFAPADGSEPWGQDPAALEATPATPWPEADRAAAPAIRDVRLLPDGRVVARIETRPPHQGPVPLLVVFSEVDGRYLLDEIVWEPDPASPSP